jgi:hypothetical protein
MDEERDELNGPALSARNPLVLPHEGFLGFPLVSADAIVFEFPYGIFERNLPFR